MFLNILHRTAHGAKYRVFREQQEMVHGLGLKTTLCLHYRDLFDDKILGDARRDTEEHGDEIALALHDMSGPGLDEVVGNLPAIWLLDKTRKEDVLGTILAKFREVWGNHPTSVASYHFDSSALTILKTVAPEVETVVGGCFEEGVRVFHGCNHSWYLFNEGMPWNPWYPSKSHSLRPANSEEDASGVVAVPHLVRDMSLSYEGRNDFWASHPPNVVRGMANDASFNPYDLNLIDQYRLQEDFNGGYSYLNTFVGASWLTWNHNSEYPPEVCWDLYRKMLHYLSELKEEGSVADMTLSEYGRWHRENRPIAEPEVYWAKEMLYDSHKHYFWYLDGDMRCLIDATQGGSIGDLRPYTGCYEVATGPDTPHREIGSYPYLIQSQHRTGLAHHHEDGSRTTAYLRHQGEELDLAHFPTRISKVDCADSRVTVALEASPFSFSSGLSGEISSDYVFPKNEGTIRVTRHIRNLSDPKAELEIIESVKGAPGRTEYAEDLGSIRLRTEAPEPASFDFDYSGIPVEVAKAFSVSATMPQVNTRLTLSKVNQSPKKALLKAGNLFSPYFTLQLVYRSTGESSIETALNLTHYTSQ